MPLQAPYEYIRDYYARVRERIAAHPDVAAFWLSSLARIKGRAVLNAGCGPTLYDYLMRFGEPPAEYVGLDINKSTFEFLERCDDPELLRMKAKAAAQGTHTEYLCGDVFAYADALAGRFDSILGIGFFATFHGTQFDRLMGIMHGALKPGGRLLKVTWHGPHRTESETEDKLKYRYDSAQEPTPEELVRAIEGAGFSVEDNAVLACDPAAVRWDAIQVSFFRKDDAAAAAR